MTSLSYPDAVVAIACTTEKKDWRVFLFWFWSWISILLSNAIGMAHLEDSEWSPTEIGVSWFAVQLDVKEVNKVFFPN